MRKPKPFINTPKIMVLVIWGVDGAVLVETVSQNPRVGAKYLCEFAILHLEASVKTHRINEGLKGITFHWDNAPNPTAKMIIATISKLEMNQMPHPTYSPDIAPSDFFLFGYLKDKLHRCSYDSALALFSAITDLTENLQKSLLHGIFDEWISPLHHVVESGREYIQR
jgi:hypothetical protein